VAQGFGKPVFLGVMVVALISGVCLIFLSLWLSPLSKADQALREGSLDAALDSLVVSESRFDDIQAMKHVFPLADSYSRVKQFYVLYQLAEYDELLEKTWEGPENASVHFWSGCALFKLAMDEEDIEARIVWLERALEEFKVALTIEPNIWDVKFNFELTGRLLAQLRKESEPPPIELPEFLRPQPSEEDPDIKPLG